MYSWKLSPYSPDGLYGEKSITVSTEETELASLDMPRTGMRRMEIEIENSGTEKLEVKIYTDSIVIRRLHVHPGKTVQICITIPDNYKITGKYTTTTGTVNIKWRAYK